MSKFFDETQRVQQRVPQAPESGRVDVVSVIEAIKQSEPVLADVPGLPSIDGLQFEIPAKIEAPVVEAEAPPPERGPIITQRNDQPLPAAASEAYRSLRTRVMKLQAKNGIRSIMITSSMPAEGKTWTSLNLSASCAKLHNLRILLVDADLRSRGLTRFLKIPDGPGLSDLLAGKTTADQSILRTDDEDLFVLGAGSQNIQPSELFASALWPEFMTWASQSYGMVIVDAPPIHSISDAELISAGCEGILIVVKALATPRDLAQKCVSRLDKRKLLGVVFNGLPSSPSNDYGYYVGSN
jgi:protein-tyrosine kinase